MTGLCKSFWSQNIAACGATRGLLYNDKEYISIHRNKSWLWSPESESSWQRLLDDSPPTARPRHSPPAPVWWLKPVYASHCFVPPSVSHHPHDAMCWNVKIEQTLFHQKKEFLLQKYMIWSFNVIVMRPIYSLGWMFSSFSQGQGGRVAWKTKTMINLKVLTPWLTHL